MLLELSIRDLALIEEAAPELATGLNVVTGETGAGKTLVVGSLELLLGLGVRGGSGSTLVRKGAKEARVEGRFAVDDGALKERLVEALRRELPELAEELSGEGDHGDDGGLELILGRVVSANGRTRAHVDQRPVPLRALRAIAAVLLEIHGQNDHQGLCEPSEQTRLLDGFGGCDAALARYAEAREAWRTLAREGEELAAEEAERRDRIELLRFQRDELESARLVAGEHAALAAERELLRSAGDLRRELGGVLEEAFDGDGALRDRLRAALHVLERRTGLLPELEGVAEDLRSALVHLDEAASSLTSLADRVEDDPGRLEMAEERLAELERLEAKHRTDESGLFARAAEIAAALAELEERETRGGELDRALEKAREETEEAASHLAAKRRAAAPRLAKAVTRVLADLGLPKARFEVRFDARGGGPAERLGPLGPEDVSFLLAANPGEEVGALSRVASGGEAARIMLALRTVLSACDRGRTLVFDEIDAGVGGRLGPEVGAHLRALARHHQVLCVTHLPAIAAQGHLHLHVAKSVSRGRTRTAVTTLDGEPRVREVADMIAGGAGEETARAEARRLLAAGS